MSDPSGHAPSSGCDYEGCLSDQHTWGWNFINYLMNYTDFSDPYDNPTGQIIVRTFEYIYPLGEEDGASINEITTEAIFGSINLVNKSMNGWYPVVNPAEVLITSAAFMFAAESDSGDHLEGGGARGGGIGGGARDGLPGGRGNPLKPDRNAVGPHSTYIRSQGTGEINHYATYQPNPRNPSGFDEELRVDMIGGKHYNKVTKEYVVPPHIQSRSIPGRVAPAERWRWTRRK